MSRLGRTGFGFAIKFARRREDWRGWETNRNPPEGSLRSNRPKGDDKSEVGFEP